MLEVTIKGCIFIKFEESIVSINALIQYYGLE